VVFFSRKFISGITSHILNTLRNAGEGKESLMAPLHHYQKEAIMKVKL
jgi:hypothetical protein